MSFPRYPEYKDSKVEWLGLLPSHWTLTPFFSRFTEGKNRNHGMRETNLLSLSYGRIVRKDINALEGLLPESFETYQIVYPENIVFRLTDLQNDKRSLRSAVVNEKGIITSAYLAVNASGFDSGYASHLFRAYDLMKVFYSMGGGLRQSMKYSDLKRLPTIMPPKLEQIQIARFLDHETAKIDTLIHEQKRLIELLKEKRQAVISHAVTKGLDPAVPMKNSGVEWLGEVPAHWKVTRGKMVADIFVPQRNKPELNDSGDGYCWVTMEDMKTDQIVASKKYVSDAAIASAGSRVLKRGAVVASCVGNFGIASVLSTDAVINQQLQAYIPRGVSAAYLREVIRCSKRYFDLVGTAATLAYVNQEGFANLPISLPSIAEQGEIELYIEKNKVKFNGAIFEGIKLIDILKERRSALISAAVTGKIDVRDWQPPTDEGAFDEEVRRAGMETTA